MGHLGSYTYIRGNQNIFPFYNLILLLSGSFCSSKYIFFIEISLYFFCQSVPWTFAGKLKYKIKKTHNYKMRSNILLGKFNFCSFLFLYLLGNQNFFTKFFFYDYSQFQVILSRMILDICKFCFLYVLVLFSFSCGKSNSDTFTACFAGVVLFMSTKAVMQR